MARKILRRGIYWANLDPTVGSEQSGTRPVLIASIDGYNLNSNTAIAFAITSQEPRAKYPLTYQLPENLLPKPSWVKIPQIRLLSLRRISQYIATIEEDDFVQIMQGFNSICGLN